MAVSFLPIKHALQQLSVLGIVEKLGSLSCWTGPYHKYIDLGVVRETHPRLNFLPASEILKKNRDSSFNHNCRMQSDFNEQSI